MPATTRFINLMGKEGLAGGLNVSDNPLIVQPSQMIVAENVSISQTLGRKKRAAVANYHTSTFVGTASYPATGTAIRGILQYWRYSTGTNLPTEDLFLHHGTKVWSIPDRVSAASDRTGALVLSATSIPSYQVFEGILYFCSSVTGDGYNKWDGTLSSPGNAVSATAPADGPGRFLGTYRARMIMSGNTTYPFRVYVSAALNAEQWVTGATSFDLTEDGDPDGVTAIFPELEGRLYIATRRSIWELTCSDPDDLNTYFIRRVTLGIGCIGHRTVVATPNDVIFCSDRGVHSLKKVVVSDQTEISFLSRDIQRIFTESLNPNLMTQAQATWDETQNLYILSCPSSGQTTNDVLLIYNITFGLWTTWIDVDARALSTVLLTNKQYVLGGTEAGRVIILDGASKQDYGTTNYNFRFQTGRLIPNNLNQTRFKSVTILVAATNIASVSLSWSINNVDGTVTGSRSLDLGNAQSLLGTTFVLGASRLGVGRFIPLKFSMDEIGYDVQFEVVSGSNADIEYFGMILEVEDADPQYT